MAKRDSPAALHGRRQEYAALDRVLAAVRASESCVLVLRDEAGIGKSALLERLVTNVDGLRGMRASGAESEIELAYVGLHEL